MSFFGSLIGVVIGVAAIAALLGTFFMWVGASLAKVKKVNFWNCLLAAIASSFVTWLVTLIFSSAAGIGAVIGFIVGVVASVFVIKAIFKADWGKAFLVWIFHVIAQIIAAAIAVMTFAGVLLTLVK